MPTKRVNRDSTSHGIQSNRSTDHEITANYDYGGIVIFFLP